MTTGGPDRSASAAPSPASRGKGGVIARRAAWATLGVVAVIALALSLWVARNAVLLMFAGLLLAVLLNALSRGLTRIARLPHVAALLVVVLGLVTIAALLAWLQGPMLAEQIGQVVGRASQGLRRLTASEAASQVMEHINLEQVLGMLPSPWGIATGAQAVVSAMVGAVTSMVIVFFVAVYLAASPGRYCALLMRLAPAPRRAEAHAMLAEAGHVLRRWLAGQMISMSVIGGVIYIGLLALGVPLAFLLAVFAGLAGFIPYIGPIIGAIPMLLVAGGDSLPLMAWVFGLYVVVQMVESHLLTPLIQSRAVAMPPAAVIAAQLLMGAIFGVLGLALATPLVAVATVPLRETMPRTPRQADPA